MHMIELVSVLHFGFPADVETRILVQTGPSEWLKSVVISTPIDLRFCIVATH